MEQVETVLETIAFVIDLIGIAILVYAALKFIAHFLAFEIKQLRGLECVEGIRDMRLRLGSYILLSLEFIIISDAGRRQSAYRRGRSTPHKKSDGTDRETEWHPTPGCSSGIA